MRACACFDFSVPLCAYVLLCMFVCVRERESIRQEELWLHIKIGHR